MTKKLYGFSGLMGSGKDWVAKEAGLTIYGFADPIYRIVKYLAGTSDKSVPGIRKMLQLVGQWGWGCVTEEYPCTIDRSLTTEAVRERGALMMGEFRKPIDNEFNGVDWQEFGQRKDFWVNILLNRVQRSSATKIGVTNVRFEHELAPLREAGFQHWHVMCSPETRKARMLAKGYPIVENEQMDASEQFAMRMDKEMPASRVIWNDDPRNGMPSGSFWVGEFLIREGLAP